MPIGKSAIKRITNNGYTNTKTTAPDMENSTVLTNPSPEVIEKMIPSAKKMAEPKTAPTEKKNDAKPIAKAKKPTAKSASKTDAKAQSATVEADATKQTKAKNPTAKSASKTTEKASKKAKSSTAPTKKTEAPIAQAEPISTGNFQEKNGFVYINVGEDLPTYLL